MARLFVLSVASIPLTFCQLRPAEDLAIIRECQKIQGSRNATFGRMNSVREAYDRLHYAASLESQLQRRLVDTKFHLPTFKTEAEQQLRQRPDYHDLLIDFYLDPEPTEPPIESETVTYTIDDISVEENNSITYKTKRLLNRADFSGNIHLSLDFGEKRLSGLGLEKHPWYDELDAKVTHYHNQTELNIYHQFTSLEDLGDMLFIFNRIFASCWSAPETIPELIEDVAKWKVYNDFKDRVR